MTRTGPVESMAELVRLLSRATVPMTMADLVSECESNLNSMRLYLGTLQAKALVRELPPVKIFGRRGFAGRRYEWVRS